MRNGAILGLCLAVLAIPSLNAEEASDPAFQSELMSRVENRNLSDSERVVQLGRLAVLMGGFAELDLGIVEMKVQPYVELRFNRVTR
jgi:hypothetical protein